MTRVLVADLNATSRSWALTSEGERRLRSAAPPDWNVDIIAAPTNSDGDGPARPSEEVMTAVRNAEVYFGFGVPRPLFLAAQKLKWVHSAAAGVGSALYDEMIASEVILTNSAGIHAVPMAEYVVAGVLHFMRGLDLALSQQRRAEWSKAAFVSADSPLREVNGCTVLVVGTGGIGTETAVRLSALGAHCVGLRRHPDRGMPPGFARVAGTAALDAELPAADVLVLTAPLTDETRGLISADRLDLLPRGAIVVNVARGALLDEIALSERLASGRLRGAVLDVFEHEPLAPGSPLWQLRSAVLTPHISPVSPGRFWPRQLDLFLDNWHRYLSGEPLRNLVDKTAGY